MKHSEGETISVYVHWPFCESKCPYCDFNSHVQRSVDEARWADAYVSEVRRVTSELPDRRLASVFFGGGTPSLMSPSTVSRILDTALEAWPGTGVEITLEANPGSADASRFAGYARAGVNRLSIGVQSLCDDGLKRLGRTHTAKAARSAVHLAQSHFPRVSMDMIYGRQDQTLTDWSVELRKAIGLGCHHLSLYQLTIEPDTAFFLRREAGNLRGLPDEHLSVGFFEETNKICSQYDLTRYEVSNFARPGHESIHNLNYWRCGEFVGIGPGAHGRIGRNANRQSTESEKAPDLWLRRVEGQGSGESERATLAPQERLIELLLMGLRTAEGVRVSQLTELGFSVSGPQVQELIGEEVLQLRQGRICIAPTSMLLLDHIVSRLASAV